MIPCVGRYERDWSRALPAKTLKAGSAALIGANLQRFLTLRSGPEGRVSKGRQQDRCSFPPFETLAALAPQGEAFETALRASSG